MTRDNVVPIMSMKDLIGMMEGVGSTPIRGSLAMRRLSVVELRRELAETLNRAEYQGERVVIHRRDKDAAAVISIEDLRLLERLVREEEDRLDLAASEAALAESDERIPYGALSRELGIERHEPSGSAVPDRAHEGRGAKARRPTKKRARSDRRKDPRPGRGASAPRR